MTSHATLVRRLAAAAFVLGLLMPGAMPAAYGQPSTATSITLPDGTVCNYTGQASSPMFEGQRANYTCTDPARVILGNPTVVDTLLTVRQGTLQNTSSGPAVTAATNVTATVTNVLLDDGTSCVLATGTPVMVNGEPMSYTCGSTSVGLLGDFNTSVQLWTASRVSVDQAAGGAAPTVRSQQPAAIRGVISGSAQPPQPTPQPTTDATAIQLPGGAECVRATGTPPSFNGKPANYTCGAAPNNGTNIILGVPVFQDGAWAIETGIMEPASGGGFQLRSSQTIRAQFVNVELDDDTSCQFDSSPTITVNNQSMNYTCGRPEEGLIGTFNTTNPLWTTVKVVVEQTGAGFQVRQEETLGITKVFGESVSSPTPQATSITLPDGTLCNFSGSGATITFNGQRANYTCSNPAIVILGTPTLQNGVWQVTTGNVQGTTITSSTVVPMTITRVELLDGAICNFAGTGTTPVIDGKRVNYTCGDPSIALIGDFNTTQPLWTAEKVTLSGSTVTARAMVGISATIGAPPVTTGPTPAPTPAPVPPPVAAPPQTRDNRYFFETNFRIGNDAFWDFFNSRGQVETFGFPVSRVFGFLGCPVQIFQRAILQQCGSSAPVALLNLLDPGLFPYTQVNGSTFPGPDEAIKNATPSTSSPTYDEDIMAFVQRVAPDVYDGQPVQFQTTFFDTGGLEIWGAPISNPAYDPGNRNFIYQRFQRGIMHYTTGQGTRGVLLADYLKAIILGPEQSAAKGASLPADLNNQARGSQLYAQYCPGATGWLCRAADMPGSDLTYAFESG